MTTDETVNSATATQKVNRLSKQQREVLVYLYEGIRQIEDACVGKYLGDEEADPESVRAVYAGRWFDWIGMSAGGRACRPAIRWNPKQFLKRDPTASEKASLCRAIRRMVDRRLLEPSCCYNAKSMMLLDMTDSGRAAASDIQSIPDPYPTELDYQHVWYPGMTAEQISEANLAEFCDRKQAIQGPTASERISSLLKQIESLADEVDDDGKAELQKQWQGIWETVNSVQPRLQS